MKTFASLVSVVAIFLSCQTPASAQEPTPPVLSPHRTFSAEPFSRIRGVVELPDGRIMVADQNEETLYLVDLDQQKRVALGRHGGGPGEYKSPTSLYPFRGDSALIVDVQNGRISMVSPEGELARSEPLFGPGFTIPVAADRFGNRYWDGVMGLRRGSRQGSGADQAPIIRYKYGLNTPDTVAYLTIPTPRPGPFPDWDLWAVGPWGRIAIVRNHQPYSLDWVETDGTILRGPPVGDFEPLAVNSSDRRTVLEGPNGGRGSGFRMNGTTSGRSAPPDIPSHFPPAKLGSIWVIPEGQAVVERSQHLSEAQPLFDVFDARGRRVGQFRLPPGRRLLGAGPSGLFAAREDQMGFLWLELYPLPAQASFYEPGGGS